MAFSPHSERLKPVERIKIRLQWLIIDALLMRHAGTTRDPILLGQHPHGPRGISVQRHMVSDGPFFLSRDGHAAHRGYYSRNAQPRYQNSPHSSKTSSISFKITEFLPEMLKDNTKCLVLKHAGNLFHLAVTNNWQRGILLIERLQKCRTHQNLGKALQTMRPVVGLVVKKEDKQPDHQVVFRWSACVTSHGLSRNCPHLSPLVVNDAQFPSRTRRFVHDLNKPPSSNSTTPSTNTDRRRFRVCWPCCGSRDCSHPFSCSIGFYYCSIIHLESASILPCLHCWSHFFFIADIDVRWCVWWKFPVELFTPTCQSVNVVSSSIDGNEQRSRRFNEFLKGFLHR